MCDIKSVSRLRRSVTTAALVLSTVASTLTLASALASAAELHQPLPAGVTDVATGRLCSVCADGVVVVRTTDGRLFFNIGSDYYRQPVWSREGWREIPGGALTPYAPAVTQWNDTVQVAITGYDNRVYLTSMNSSNSTWGTWQEVPGGGRLAEGPALVGEGYTGTLTVVGRGLDSQIWYRQYYNGWRPDGWRLMPGGFKTPSAVAAAELEGMFFIVARGYDNRIYYDMTYNMPLFGDWGPMEDTWSPTGMTQIPGGGVTFHAPALSLSYDNALHVLVRGTDGGLWYQTVNDQLKWNAGWSVLPGGGLTNRAPAAARAGSTLFAFVVGIDDQSVWTQGLRSQSDGTLTDMFGHGWAYVPLSTPPMNTPPPIPTPKPDLVWTGAPTYNSDTKRIQISFRNAGNAAAGAFRVSAIVDNGSLGEAVYTSLASGQGDTVSFSPGSLSSGDHTYNFVLDVYNTVNESNENNNSYNGYLPIP